MRRLELNTGTARLVGEACGAGTDFLLLHAGGETRRVWRPVMQAMADAGVSSAAYDQRGHGESGGSTSDGVSAYGHDAAAMLEAHGEMPIVVGASLGGFAAILALSEPGGQVRAKGLVLVDVTPISQTGRVRGFLRKLGPDIAAAPLVEDILRQPDRFHAAIAAIDLPILLVRAGAGGPVSDDDVLHLKRLCPRLQVTCIDAAGHLVARDAPLDLARALLDFRTGIGEGPGETQFPRP